MRSSHLPRVHRGDEMSATAKPKRKGKRETLAEQLLHLADLNRPSMCSEVSKMLRELAAKVKAGTA